MPALSSNQLDSTLTLADRKKEGLLLNPLLSLQKAKLATKETRQDLLKIIKDGATIDRESLRFVTLQEGDKSISFMLKESGDAIGATFGNAILRILSDKKFASRRTLPLKARVRGEEKIFIASKLDMGLTNFCGEDSMFNEDIDVKGRDKNFVENCARLWGASVCASDTDFNSANILRSRKTGRPVIIDINALGNHVFGHGVHKPYGSAFANDFLRTILAGEKREFIEKKTETAANALSARFEAKMNIAELPLKNCQRKYEKLVKNKSASLQAVATAKKELETEQEKYKMLSQKERKIYEKKWHQTFVDHYQEGIDANLLTRIKKNINKQGNEHLKDFYIEFIHGLQDSINLAFDDDFFDKYCKKFKTEFGEEAFAKVTILRRFFKENAIMARAQFKEFIEYCQELENEKKLTPIAKDLETVGETGNETIDLARSNNDSGISSGDSELDESEDEERRLQSIRQRPQIKESLASNNNELKNYIAKFSEKNIRLIDLGAIDKFLQNGFDANSKINNLSLLEYVSSLAYNKGNFIDKAATIVAKLIKSGAEIDQKILNDKNFAKIIGIKFKPTEINEIKQQVEKNGKAVFKEERREIAIEKKQPTANDNTRKFATLAAKKQTALSALREEATIRKMQRAENITEFKPAPQIKQGATRTITANQNTAILAESKPLPLKAKPDFETKFQETAKSFAFRKTENETFATLNSALKKIAKYAQHGTANSVIKTVWPENSQQKGENILSKSEMQVLTNFAYQISSNSEKFRLEGKMKTENDTLSYAHKQLVLQPIIHELKKGDLAKWSDKKNKPSQEITPSASIANRNASRLSSQNLQQQA